MTTSKIISGLMGPTFEAVAISMLLNHRAMPAMIEQAAHQPALITLSGIATFVAGLAIVRTHNVWEFDWPVIVTVLGWLFVIGGLVRILFPTRVAAMATGFVENGGFVIGEAIILLVLGAFLTYKAYSSD